MGVAEWECGLCGATFEGDGKLHPHGILCPECNRQGRSPVGVLQPIRKPDRRVADEPWRIPARHHSEAELYGTMIWWLGLQ